MTTPTHRDYLDSEPYVKKRIEQLKNHKLAVFTVQPK
jgi:hypothetical protein